MSILFWYSLLPWKKRAHVLCAVSAVDSTRTCFTACVALSEQPSLLSHRSQQRWPSHFFLIPGVERVVTVLLIYKQENSHSLSLHRKVFVGALWLALPFGFYVPLH